MIRKITRGWRAGGLIRYLMGPGRHNEHTNQHVVASWDGQPELHQPRALGNGEFDVSELVSELTLPAVTAGVPQTEPHVEPGAKMPRGPVWHCSLRNHADDRILSDQEWSEVIEEVMHRTGIAPRGDLGGCRWVAVRHADDHVHIAAVLVREDNGRKVLPRKFFPRNDYLRVGQVCREAETRLGLTPTAPEDRTALKPSTRAEHEKADRAGKPETSRAWLRRVARIAAVRARDPEAYFEALRELGALVDVREHPPGQPVGYAVAVPDDVNAAGRPVWFSGRALGRDLSLPQLRERWASAPTPPDPIPPAPTERSRVGRVERDTAVAEAVSAIEHATAAVAAGEPDAADAVIHATEDMLNAVDAITASGRLPQPRGCADAFQRAARTPRVGQPTRWPQVAGRLRTAAWRLILVRNLLVRSDSEGGAGQLFVALAALLAEIAAYQEQKRCLAQARAARESREALAVWRPPSGPATPRGGQPGPSRAADKAPAVRESQQPRRPGAMPPRNTPPQPRRRGPAR